MVFKLFCYVFWLIGISFYILYTSEMHYIYWPVEQEMKFDWKIIVGSIVGFLGAALGSVGGVGGGGIFVPMLALIIGFDPKSSTAISKCKCVCVYIIIMLFYR